MKHHRFQIHNLAMAIGLFLSLPIAAQSLQKREQFEYVHDLPCYVDSLQEELTYPQAWGNSSITDFTLWKKSARQTVFNCMMLPPKRASQFNYEVMATELRDGYIAKKICFNINAYARITAYLLVPKGDKPHPAVIALHDHGGHLFIGKEKVVRPIAENSEVAADAQAWVEKLYDGRYVGDELAKRGYVVLALDAPLWGERGRKEGVDRKKYDIIAGNMMMLGRDLSAFMTYDDIAATDFLASLPCVDAKRIGCFGFSMGAYRSWMLAALSEKIAAGVCICWMVTTRAQLSLHNKRTENGGFANCIPGLRQYLDYPHIASIACPKPMLFIGGTQDKLFPVKGVEDAYATMHNVWKSQQADNRLETELWDMPHHCGIDVQERAFSFLDQWLKPEK